MKPFFVFSLPRSRSAWLSVFLTGQKSFCFHEAICDVKKMEELRQLFLATEVPVVGNSDPTNIYFAEAILNKFPGAPIVVVERPVADVHRSLAAIGMSTDIEELHRLEGLLSELSWNYSNSIKVPFSRLDEIQVLESIWDHCIGDNKKRSLGTLGKEVIDRLESGKEAFECFDEHRARQLLRLNIQVSSQTMRHTLQYCPENISSLLKETGQIAPDGALIRGAL